METIYLDHQVLVDFYDNRIDKKDLLDIDKNRFKVFYSPAHCEEICNGFVKGAYLKEDTDRRLELLYKITDGNEVLPYYSPRFKIQSSPYGRGGILLVTEKPHTCFDRVIKNISSNPQAEDTQKTVLEDSQDKFEGLSEKQRADEINRIKKLDPVKDILKSKDVLNKMKSEFVELLSQSHALINMHNRGIAIQPFTEKIKRIMSRDAGFLHYHLKDEYDSFADRVLVNPKKYFPIIAKRHATIETLIDVVMRNLAREYYYGDAVKKFSSSLHDHSHAIYGSYFDYFVTRDDNFRKRVSAAYEFLGIKTQVINAKDTNWFDLFSK